MGRLSTLFGLAVFTEIVEGLRHLDQREEFLRILGAFGQGRQRDGKVVVVVVVVVVVRNAAAAVMGGQGQWLWYSRCGG